MQRDANLVELEKRCRTHIFLQNFVFDTAENEPAKNLQNFANFLDFANRFRLKSNLVMFALTMKRWSKINLPGRRLVPNRWQTRAALALGPHTRARAAEARLATPLAT